MKKTLFTFLMLFFTIFAYSQQLKLSTKIPKVGDKVNVTVVSGKTFNLDVKKPKTKEQQIGKAKATSNKAIFKAEEYPVYATEKGKLFIVTPNKDNTGYNKKYIPEGYNY